MPSRTELLHYRLQAILRDYNMPDLEYLGERLDIIGVNQHWYSINGHEVPVDAITELDNVEELDESDPV